MEGLDIVARDRPVFSLVLPAYNPGGSIRETWRQVVAWWRAQPVAWEVLFVCDGCSDDSPAVLEGLRAELFADAPAAGRAIRVLTYSPNRGKGYAVRWGLSQARGRFLLFTDVDLAYGWSDVAGVAEALRRGGDVAIADRLHPDSRVELSPDRLGYAWRRHVQGRAFSWLVKRLLGLPFDDTQAGLKGLSADAAARLLPLLEADRFEFDCELLALAVRLKMDIRRVPVMVRHRRGDTTTTGVGTAFAMLRAAVAMRSRLDRKALPTATEAAPARRAA